MSNTTLPLSKMARELKVPQRWLREQAETGTIPGLKTGRNWLFDEETVKRVIANLAKGASDDRR